ncbi:MAG: hypothetical protein JXR45_24695 [Deltaproteobacteria bacterium]|nr:hypothetical protein [Deltaproteobacteria bacterium]
MAPDESAQSAPVRIAIVCDAFDGMDMPAIERTIRSQSSDLEVEITFHEVADVPATSVAQDELGASLIEQTGAAAAFVIYSNDDLVNVSILLKTDDGIEKSYRSVNVSAGTPLREALGVIVRASITTIINRTKQIAKRAAEENKAKPSTQSGQPAGSSESADPNVDEPDSVAGARSTRGYFSVGAAGGLFSGSATPWLGMDLALGVNWGRHWGAHIGYVAFSNVSAEESDVKLTISRHPIQFGVRFGAPVRRVHIGGGFAALLWVNRERVDAPPTGWTVNSDNTEVGAALAIYTEVNVSLFGSVHFFSRLGADVLLYSPVYRIAASQSEFVVLKPWGIQPNITIGVKLFFF